MTLQYRFIVIAILHMCLVFLFALRNTFNVTINSMIKRIPTNISVSYTNCSSMSQPSDNLNIKAQEGVSKSKSKSI